jgi:AcrR family transcriptional regulator
VGLDRAAVVQAAATLVDIGGLEAVSLADIAARLGVRTPSLYNHVDGLPGLRRELALLGTRELAARVGRSAIGKSGDEAIFALAHAYRAFVIAHPGLYAATVRSARLREQEDPELEAAQAEVVEIVLAVIAVYGLHDAAALHVVRGLRSLVHGFATIETSGGFGIPLDLDTSFQQLIAIFIAGLRTHDTQS